jgi:phosphate transport system substrate-binding protein
MRTITFLAAAAAITSGSACSQEPAPASIHKPESALAPYALVSGITGNLDSIGSDTLNNLMTYWSEAFQKHYPNVRIQVEGKGSSTAPPALIKGTAQLGPMSRKMKGTEVDEFEKAFGYKPTAVRVAVDGLAVYVHKDCPLETLSMEQVDAIFSSTRKGGLPAIETWGQLGLEGDWADKPIRLYGRNSASGTYQYFKENALYNGDFKNSVKEQPGSASVVRSVAEDRFGMGYSGLGYRTAGVKSLTLSQKRGEPAYGTDEQVVLSGNYPLSRFLYVYVNKSPKRGLDPLIREFLRFALSVEGQEVVAKDGYLPLPKKIVDAELTQLEGTAR